VQQLSDLFVENCYSKFQDDIQFFSYYNSGTLKHRDSESFRGCNRHFPSLASCYLHDSNKRNTTICCKFPQLHSYQI